MVSHASLLGLNYYYGQGCRIDAERRYFDTVTDDADN